LLTGIVSEVLTSCCCIKLTAFVVVVAAAVGEIVAECSGPSKMAFTTLIDRRDGTFELIIRPQEVGQHKLQLTYDREPVPGL